MNKLFSLVKLLVLSFLLAGVWTGCQSQQPEPAPPSPTPAPAETAAVQAAAAEPDGTEPAVEVVPEDVAPAGAAAVGLERVRIFSADDVPTLEPYRMVGAHPAGSAASHIWDALTWLDDDLQVEPHLAESWRLINNFTWEVHLRPNISFHNGEPVNAEAVEFSVERARSMPGSLETFAQDVALKEVEIVDEHTLRFITDQPAANLPYHLAFLEILPPRYYSETDSRQLAVAPVGSGPYQVLAWRPGEELILEAAADYWKGTPAISQLVFEAVPRSEDRLAGLRLGEATLVTDLPPVDVEAWPAPESKVLGIESTQRMFVGMRIAEGAPLEDVSVRQALNYGVNVDEITRQFFEGYGVRYGSWVNPPWNKPDLPPWPYDPEMARQLLAKAGYREGITLTLQTPKDVYHQDIEVAETIAGQLSEIGVTVEVEAVEWNAYTRQIVTGEAGPLFLLALNSHGDGLEDLKALSAEFTYNPTGWQNNSFENLVGQASNTFNTHAQTRLLHEAQAIAYEEAPWIWLWKTYDFYGISNDLEWRPRADGLVNLYTPLNISE